MIVSEIKVGWLVTVGNIITKRKITGEVIKITPKYFHVRVNYITPIVRKFNRITLLCKENVCYHIELD